MVLIFIDEFVTKDTIIGPMPNLVSSFDNFFVWKCSELLDLNDSLSKKHQNKVTTLLLNVRITFRLIEQIIHRYISV